MKENRKREGEKLEMERGKVTNWGENLFAFHFSKPLFLFCFVFFYLLKWEFSTRKKHFTQGKDSEKWLCPLWKIFLLRPCSCALYSAIAPFLWNVSWMVMIVKIAVAVCLYVPKWRILRGNCTSFPKVSMFYALSQNYQHFIASCSKLSRELKNSIKI